MRYCKSCGNQIPQARVNILPGVKLCVGCAEGRVPKKLAITELIGGEEHGYTDIRIVSEDQFDGTLEQRDILDVEPDQFAKDPRIPLTIKKRKDL